MSDLNSTRSQGYGRCPRCGLPIDNIIIVKRGKRKYIVAYHSSSTTGGRPRYCYLGPADHYVYVAGMYGLNLMSPFFQDYYSLALWALSMLDESQREEILRELGKGDDRARRG